MPDINPYEPPEEPTLSKPVRKTNLRKAILLVVLAILAGPSALVAGFTTCFVTMLATEKLQLAPGAFLPGFEVGLFFGLLTVLVVLVLFVYAMIRINRRPWKDDANNPPTD